MKKIYVKPMATNVAFVVNENIASSLRVEGNPGITKLTQDYGDNCNKVFFDTGIPTNLKDGVFDFDKAYSQLDSATLAQILAVITGPDNTAEYASYSACFFG